MESELLLPLPLGEGRGEGAKLSAQHEMTRSSFSCRKVAPHDKKEKEVEVAGL
jgi:hypothetical protein